MAGRATGRRRLGINNFQQRVAETIGLSNAGYPSSASNHALQDYHKQMTLLEEENKRRLLMTPQDKAVDDVARRGTENVSLESGHAPQDYQTQLMSLEEQKKEWLLMPQQEAVDDAATKSTENPSLEDDYALQDYQMQMILLEEQNKKRRLKARQEQDLFAFQL